MNDTTHIWIIIPKYGRPINSIWLSPGFASLFPYLPQEDIKILNMNFIDNIDSEISAITDAPTHILFSCFIDNVQEIIILIRYFKNRYPKAFIIVGGPHVTLLGNKISNVLENVDLFIFGEGEEQLASVIKSNISETDTRKDNIKQRYIPKLDTLRTPDYSILSKFPHFPSINYETTRGCSSGCPYCAYPKLYGKGIRRKSIIKIQRELNVFINKYQINHFRFIDSSLPYSNTRFNELLSIFNQLDDRIYWCCFSRLDHLYSDPELCESTLVKARDAGCQSMFIGVESGCNKSLKSIGRHYNKDDIINFSRIASKVGIHIHGNFIIGFPNEDLESIQTTFQVIKDSDFDSITVNPLYLIPHSDYHMNAEERGITILEEEWELNLHKHFHQTDEPYFLRGSLSESNLHKMITQIRKNVDSSETKYWDLKDYKLLAWHSIGGSETGLKKLWKAPSKYLSTRDVTIFKVFKNIAGLKITNAELNDLVKTITSIAKKEQ